MGIRSGNIQDGFASFASRVGNSDGSDGRMQFHQYKENDAGEQFVKIYNITSAPKFGNTPVLKVNKSNHSVENGALLPNQPKNPEKFIAARSFWSSCKNVEKSNQMLGKLKEYKLIP